MDDIIESKMCTRETVKVENVALRRIRVYRTDIRVSIRAILFEDLKVAYGNGGLPVQRALRSTLSRAFRRTDSGNDSVRVKNAINTFNTRE